MPKPSRYFPRSWVCSTSSRSSSAASNRNAVDLCTPMSAATSLTPASPRWARISSTLMARSTDCTPPVPSPRSLLIAQLYETQLHIAKLDAYHASIPIGDSDELDEVRLRDRRRRIGWLRTCQPTLGRPGQQGSGT